MSVHGCYLQSLDLSFSPIPISVSLYVVIVRRSVPRVLRFEIHTRKHAQTRANISCSLSTHSIPGLVPVEQLRMDAPSA